MLLKHEEIRVGTFENGPELWRVDAMCSQQGRDAAGGSGKGRAHGFGIGSGRGLSESVDVPGHEGWCAWSVWVNRSRFRVFATGFGMLEEAFVV